MKYWCMFFNMNKDSNYFSSMIRGLSGILLFLAAISNNCFSASYQIEAGTFKNLDVNDSWSTNITPSVYASYSSLGANLFGFANSTSSYMLCGETGTFYPSYGGLYPVTSIDGYSGIQISSGVILVPMNLSVSGAGTFSNFNNQNENKSYNSTITSNSQGIRSAIGTQSNPNLWCGTLQNINETYTHVRGNVFTSSGSVSWGVYASTTAKAGTYSIPAIFTGVSIINALKDSQWFPSKLNGSSIIVTKPLECSISSPTTIDFGIVNITGVSNNSLLGTKMQGLNIVCFSEDPNAVTEKVRVSFIGEYESTYWGRLNIKNKAGKAMGYIRGRYLNDGGSCSADTVNEVGFNGINGIKIINNVRAGTLPIPITWSLCSNGSGLLGEGTGKATVNIDWD